MPPHGGMPASAGPSSHGMGPASLVLRSIRQRFTSSQVKSSRLAGRTAHIPEVIHSRCHAPGAVGDWGLDLRSLAP